MEYDYTAGKIRKRTDISWNGPGKPVSGEYGEERKLVDRETVILGKYYIKELSRSEGYGLSVKWNGSEITNRGSRL